MWYGLGCLRAMRTVYMRSGEYSVSRKEDVRVQTEERENSFAGEERYLGTLEMLTHGIPNTVKYLR